MATTSSQIPVPAPLRLAGNVAGDWKRFRGQWINYAKAVKLASEDADCQAAVFLACIGPDAYELMNASASSETLNLTVCPSGRTAFALDPRL